MSMYLLASTVSLLLVCSAGVQGRSLLAVARTAGNVAMPKIRSDEWGPTSSLDLTFITAPKFRKRACQSLELISEAIEVIYAFAVDAEPAEVAVSSVSCSREELSLTVGFVNHLGNKTLATLSTGSPPAMLASTLAPFGLSLSETKVSNDS